MIVNDREREDDWVRILIYFLQVDMLQDPGRPGSPITGERSDMEVARSASLGLWSCAKGRKNKQVFLTSSIGWITEDSLPTCCSGPAENQRSAAAGAASTSRQRRHAYPSHRNTARICFRGLLTVK